MARGLITHVLRVLMAVDVPMPNEPGGTEPELGGQAGPEQHGGLPPAGEVPPPHRLRRAEGSLAAATRPAVGALNA